MLQVSAAGSSQNFSVTEPSGWIETDIGFTFQTFTFTATGTSTNLVFASLDTGGSQYGALIADVHVMHNTGDAGNYLSGGAGNDFLVGGGGADIFVGGSGADTIVGAGGNDTVDYATSSAAVTVNLASSGAQSGGDAAGDILSGISNTVGSDYNDAITGNSSDNLMTGGIGNDTLTGGSGSDTFIYHVGDGNDTIAGGGGASWTDAISLSDGTSSLGTFGVDWTLSITSGSIVSTDTTNHVIALSQDAVGQIDLSNGATIHFAELERVTW
jgi:Ca2+-binding RTX toxin-like protein